MAESSVVDRNYTYSRRGGIWAPEAGDVHDVEVTKRRTNTRVSPPQLSLSITSSFPRTRPWVAFFGGLFAVWSFKGSCSGELSSKIFDDSESVVVMPTFGIQLETHYSSGQVLRCLVPVSKFLKPVLVECVTPVTYYWSLSLVLQDERDLMLVFKELRPPLKMLVPIWKALCLASGDPESTEASVEVVRRCQRSSKLV